MRCKECKKEIPDGSAFCNCCGAKQAPDASPSSAPSRTARKRGNGQGTAVKRGKTWTAVWQEESYVDSETKKLKRVRRWKGGFKTKTAALAFAAEPKVTPAESPTLRAYYDLWKSADYLDLSKSKQTAFNIAWRRMEYLASRTMDSLTIKDLQDCVNENAPTYYPARDIKTLFSHLFKRAVAEGNARTNLADYIRLPKLEEKEPAAFKEDELKKIWNGYGNGSRVLGCGLVMIYSGMMPGELFKLKTDMIDWEKREISGVGLKTKERKKTPLVFPEMIVPVLEYLCSTTNSKVGFVVGMTRDNFYDEWKTALKEIGVSPLTPYACRHTTATALALGNIAPSVIQKVMRHTKFATTQRYIHPDMESAHEAIDQLK